MDINTTQLIKNNLRVVAVGKDKRALGKWGYYRNAQTPEQLKKEVNKTGNFAVICTDGLECIDIDQYIGNLNNLSVYIIVNALLA